MNEESFFDFPELFFSITDRRGIILDTNDVFERVSEYPREALLNKPHNIIRHPDMPKAVFKLFWQFLKENKPVIAFVKNLSHTGKYYWVLATAFPVDTIYVSLRIKPSSHLFIPIKRIYAEILKLEQEGQPIDACMEALLERVKTLGYKSYEDFMFNILYEELQHRDRHIERNLSNDPNNVALMIMNLIFLSNKLGEIRTTLLVVASNMKLLDPKDLSMSTGFSEKFKAIDTFMRDILFKISVARLQIEMIPLYKAMKDNSDHVNDAQLLINCASILKLITTNFNEVINEISGASEKNEEILCFIDKSLQTIFEMEEEQTDTTISHYNLPSQAGTMGKKMQALLTLLQKACSQTTTLSHELIKQFEAARKLLTESE